MGFEKHQQPGREAIPKYLKELLGKDFHPELVVVLSGGIVKNTSVAEKATGMSHRTPSYRECDDKGLVSGGKARVIASASLHEYFPDAEVLTMSHTKNKKDEEPSHAEVIAEEIQERGVPAEKIVQRKNSYSTISEIREIALHVKNGNMQNLVVISNEYHLPRVREMFNRAQELLGSGEENDEVEAALKGLDDANIVFVSAEDILKGKGKKYERLFEKIESSSSYQGRLKAEERGLKDLRAGKYKK